MSPTVNKLINQHTPKLNCPLAETAAKQDKLETGNSKAKRAICFLKLRVLYIELKPWSTLRG
jgi:hypothetical protein